MHKNTSVTLGKYFDQFISRQIAEERFGSASEMVRAGLRVLEEQKTRLEALRRALREGEESGRAEYSLEGLIEGLNQESAS